ncbi:hypothetical protein BRD17_06885 [Halobacteriales archaeon SW_7_68_16]|nr:MAG: hypothetical protein BRD17_06885 [Halobacteriales archaeon SW_7_68_16]
MEMPQSTRPPVDSIPGPVVAAGSHAAADLRVSYHGPDSRFGGDDAYLALAAATPYNRLTLPEMGVEGTLRRDSESVASGRLERTIDHELGYHYGIAVPEVRDGDGFDLTFLAPPQVARHVGYESAFVTMTETSLPISL